MATFRASFMQVSEEARPDVQKSGDPLPVGHLSTAQRLTDLTTSGTSQEVQFGGSDWTSPGNGMLVVFCDGAVHVAAATTPTAAATAGFYIAANTYHYLTVAKDHKLAVINA